MKRFFCLLLLTIGLPLLAQNSGQYEYIKLDESRYRQSKDYKACNKYQKDAIIFMDMVADTHPYYVKAERREEWLAQKPALLEQCKDIRTDEAFVDVLNAVLRPLHDDHTGLVRGNRPAAETREKPGATEAIDKQQIMQPHRSNYDYTLFPGQGICYLQFNRCSDMTDNPFERFLEDMFARMEEADIKTLVVDAQYNPGGNSRLCGELLLHLFPADQLKDFTTSIRFSDLLSAQYPRMAQDKKNWERRGHVDELYQFPPKMVPEGFRQPKLFEGQVIFIMGKRTFSSAGILMTLARDNHIGTIIGTASTFSPSHYGELLFYSLPNTGVQGTVSCKYFARPDASSVDEPFLKPDVEIDLDDKEATWKFICETYGQQ